MMKPAERTLVYSALFLLALANAASLLGLSAQPALASVAAAPDGLGPAATLTLAADGQKDVVLRNHKGKLAWTETDYGKAYTVGFVHIGKVLMRLMESKALAEERDSLTTEFKKADEDFRARILAVRQRGDALERESPEFRAVFEEHNKLMKEYRDWSTEFQGRFDKLSADHLEKCYRDLVNAVEIVGDRKGIDMVYRFIPTSEKFDAGDEEQALNAIRLRTVLKYPDGLDITPEVLEELALSAD